MKNNIERMKRWRCQGIFRTIIHAKKTLSCDLIPSFLDFYPKIDYLQNLQSIDCKCRATLTALFKYQVIYIYKDIGVVLLNGIYFFQR